MNLFLTKIILNKIKKEVFSSYNKSISLSLLIHGGGSPFKDNEDLFEDFPFKNILLAKMFFFDFYKNKILIYILKTTKLNFINS